MESSGTRGLVQLQVNYKNINLSLSFCKGSCYVPNMFLIMDCNVYIGWIFIDIFYFNINIFIYTLKRNISHDVTFWCCDVVVAMAVQAFIYIYTFLKKSLRFFVVPLVLTVSDFGWLRPWVSKPGSVDAPLLALRSRLCVMMLRVNSDKPQILQVFWGNIQF